MANELRSQDSVSIKSDSGEVSVSVLASAANLTAVGALAYGSALGTAHGELTSAYCNSISVKAHEGGTHKDVNSYIVTSSFSTKAIDSPINKPDEYSWQSETNTQEYFRDKNDDPVVSSNGEPFEAQPTKLTSLPVCTVVQYNATATISRQAYVGTVNSGNLTLDGVTFAARQVLFAGLSISAVQEENDVSYRTETYTFKIAAAGGTWVDKVLAIGFQELDDNKKRIDIHEPNTIQNVRRPWPLDANGKKKPNADDDPATITYYPYEEVDMSSWGFS